MPSNDRATPAPTRLRRLRRPQRPHPAHDLVVGVVLFLALGIAYVVRMFGYGMDLWAAQGADGAADRVARAQLGFTWGLLCVALGLAGVASLLRARWTAVIQLLAALVLLAFALLLRHDWERSHPAPPAPLPSWYVPCYSGSGRCN
ncbi:DUF6234 family protein [Kitasatospora sp. NPDC058162]|uniref:DUF6234 family protein n=1 Tax=Kitasatospora sp. NPDC058162 TaxID=3346362 RepID=UPI0036DA0B57